MIKQLTFVCTMVAWVCLMLFFGAKVLLESKPSLKEHYARKGY
jgi:hypothetical protein